MCLSASSIRNSLNLKELCLFVCLFGISGRYLYTSIRLPPSFGSFIGNIINCACWKMSSHWSASDGRTRYCMYGCVRRQRSRITQTTQRFRLSEWHPYIHVYTDCTYSPSTQSRKKTWWLSSWVTFSSHFVRKPQPSLKLKFSKVARARNPRMDRQTTGWFQTYWDKFLVNKMYMYD